MHFLALFHTAISIQPPPLRGTSFHRKEGVSTQAPSLGMGKGRSEAGLASFFGGEAASSLLSPRGKGCVSRIAVFSYRSLPHWGRGTASAVDRVLSLIVDLRCISPLIFHTASTLSGSLRSPPSPRGEGFVRPYCFSTYACIRSDNARKAMLPYRSLPPWGRLRIHAKCDQNPRRSYFLMRRASILNPSTYETILLFAR